jgi:single-stranded-DNA-specific exonuclease
MKFRWSPAPPQPLLAGQLASQLKISPLLAQCLLNRGFSEPSAIQNYLQPRLKNLADPFLLPNMDSAIGRLLRAREQNESLVIFGDYDVDGVTSTALLLEVLRPLGWRVDFYLPSRMEEGYGLSADGVENCLKNFRRHCFSRWTAARRLLKPSLHFALAAWTQLFSITIRFQVLRRLLLRS